MSLDWDYEPEADTCHECGELAVGYDEGTPVCANCYRSRFTLAVEGPPDPPDVPDAESDDDTPIEPTPILNDPDDPGEHLEPHKPELGGES